MADEKNTAGIPLSEYPRPQFERDSYICLNGRWEYAIVSRDSKAPKQYDGYITVPYSPECKLSGVGRTLQPSQHLWYKRSFTLPGGFNKGRVLLHFGAVDQQAIVYINGIKAGIHEGGYTPFSVDITSLIAGRTENLIAVRVRDRTDRSYITRGKQKLRHGGIWYAPQSGIWQTVWLESVPEQYIYSIRMTPLPDERVLRLTVFTADDDKCLVETEGRTIEIATNKPGSVPIKNMRLWSPEDPYLYPLRITYHDDTVKSYFGMRKFSVGEDGEGVKRLMLNDKPYFRTGLLDQGYYYEGMYTPRSDEDMINDIQTAKALGFNMLRKHVKTEPLRWYYHCDRLGMLVWQDMINGGGSYDPAVTVLPLFIKGSISDLRFLLFGRGDEAGRRQFRAEVDEIIDTLYNCVSIELWTLFNEGWGQFDSVKLAERVRMKDKSRFIDHASGWHDQGIGDICSRHVYFRPYRYSEDKHGRAVALTEFGGYTLKVDGHFSEKKVFGYKKYETPLHLTDAIKKLYEKEIIPAAKQGLSACVYTQLTDVEEELNGIMTLDREVVKPDMEVLRKLNEQLRT